MKKFYLFGIEFVTTNSKVMINVICVSEKELRQAPLIETLKCISNRKEVDMGRIQIHIKHKMTFTNMFFVQINELEITETDKTDRHLGNVGENIEIYLNSITFL